MSATNGDPHDIIDGFVEVPFHPGVKVFHMMSPEDRAALFAKLRELHALPRDRWHEQDAVPLSPPLQETYLVPFQPQLLVFFTPQPNGLFRVEDVTSEAALDRYSTSRHETIPS